MASAPSRATQPRIGLGTVQFGLPYGIANTSGQVAPAEVAQMLRLAADAEVAVLDTAPGYGDAEAVVGECLPEQHPFDIVTKTAKLAGLSDDDAAAQVHATFRSSLEKLRQSAVYGLLAHDANDLFRPQGRAIWGAMTELRRQGLVRKLGASVYTPAQLGRVRKLEGFDLVQVPFNIFDRRLAGAALQELKRDGIEVHARSAFLQGLIFLSPERAAIVSAKAAQAVEKLRNTCGATVEAIAKAALAVPFQTRDLDVVVLGTAGLRELQQLLGWVGASRTLHRDEGGESAITDDFVVNPALWPPASGFLGMLTGTRLALRRFGPADLSDPLVGKHLAAELPNEELSELIERDDAILFGIFPRNDGAAVGMIKLDLRDRAQGGGELRVRVGARHSRDSDLTTEAIALITRFGFESLGLTKLTADVPAADRTGRSGFSAAGWPAVHPREVGPLEYGADDYWAKAR